MKAPDEGEVLAYISFLRGDEDNPDHTGGTISNYVNAISSMCHFYGLDSPADSPQIQRIIKEYEEDGITSTATFDFVNDLPNLYLQCWSMKRWSMAKMLQCWAMFLIAICLMGRASDLCQFCPVYEDILLPSKQNWDLDGYPKYIDIGMR
jgi:hypothetical protein